MTNQELTFAVLHLADEYEMHESLWWRTDEKTRTVRFLINCNDLFYWATADCEEITEENLPTLEQAFKDAMAMDGCIANMGLTLFPCRVRKMRPQQPVYRNINPKWWPLLDACGPIRDRKDEG